MARAAAAKPAEKPIAPDSWGRVIEFERGRETKNKVVYTETEEPIIVGTLYVSKAFAKDMGDPEKIAVDIQPVG